MITACAFDGTPDATREHPEYRHTQLMRCAKNTMRNWRRSRAEVRFAIDDHSAV